MNKGQLYLHTHTCIHTCVYVCMEPYICLALVFVFYCLFQSLICSWNSGLTTVKFLGSKTWMPHFLLCSGRKMSLNPETLQIQPPRDGQSSTGYRGSQMTKGWNGSTSVTACACLGRKGVVLPREAFRPSTHSFVPELNPVDPRGGSGAGTWPSCAVSSCFLWDTCQMGFSTARKPLPVRQDCKEFVC